MINLQNILGRQKWGHDVKSVLWQEPMPETHPNPLWTFICTVWRFGGRTLGQSWRAVYSIFVCDDLAQLYLVYLCCNGPSKSWICKCHAQPLTLCLPSCRYGPVAANCSMIVSNIFIWAWRGSNNTDLKKKNHHPPSKIYMVGEAGHFSYISILSFAFIVWRFSYGIFKITCKVGYPFNIFSFNSQKNV